MKFKLSPWVASMAALSSISTPNVIAQTDNSGPTLEEIVVTAQRREENLQSSPVSVVAIGGARMADLGVNDPQTLADFVPNLSMGDGTGRGAGGTSISIRGVNEARVSPVLDPAVGIYIDDVYYGRPQTAFLKLLDVDRVEVLRGPQGTLFGKNSMGGALRYITQKPDFEDTRGYIKTTFGDYDRIDVKGAVNIPLSDNSAIRVSAATLARDGFVDRLAARDALGDENTQFGSLHFRWAPSDELEIHLGLDYTQRETDDGATKLIDYFGFNGSPDSGGNASVRLYNSQWGNSPLAYNASIPTSLYEVAGTGADTRNESESKGAVLNISYQLTENIALKSITGYREVDEFTIRDPDDQESAFTFFDDRATEGTDFFSQELQLSGLAFDGRLNWVTGVYYSKDEPFRIDEADRDGRGTQLGARGPQNLTAYGAVLLNDSAFQETESFGVFAQGTMDITQKLALTLGVRYTEDDKSFTVSQVAVWDAELAALAEQLSTADSLSTARVPACDPAASGSCVTQAPITGGDTFDSTTPRIAIEYQWSDDIMTYASASKGFKSGGTNDTVADIDTPFDPEELWSYEIGIRSEFLSNRVRTNLTFFTMEYEGKQITVSPSDDNDVPCTNRCTFNAGDATIDGWELEALFAATDNLTLHANVGGLEAEWDKVVDGAGISLQSDFARTPEISYNLGGRYNVNLASGASLIAMVDYAYKDEQESSPQDSTTLTIPDYDLVTARLKWVSEDAGWEVSIFCTNCADEEYITGGAAWAGTTDNTPFDYKPLSHPAFAANGGTQGNPNGVAPPGISLVNVGAPRRWGVDFKFSF